MTVLVLVGSLRAGSLNRRLARAAVAELPADTDVRFFDRLAELPHYDQDLDGDGAPGVVTDLRNAVREADALLVVTPEYNGAPSGVIKNAIDWASRPRASAGIAGTRTAVLAATGSPRGAQWAREAAVRILAVAGADVLEPSVGLATAHEALEGDTITNDAKRQAVAELMTDLVQGDRAEGTTDVARQRLSA
jgi:NAD(P)H-dependent FMN reductase